MHSYRSDRRRKLYSFGLIETSEKTAEINTLSDFAGLIERISGRKVTLICPTARDEKDLGFDEIVEGLPHGSALAFQFKRPFSLQSVPDCTRFSIDTLQLDSLLNNFSFGEAYYVFVPYPHNNDIIRNRRHVLEESVSVDAYDIPRPVGKSQKSRTVRYYRTLTVHGTRSRTVQITDPRTYMEVEKTDSLKNLGMRLAEGKVGFRTPLDEKRRLKYKEGKRVRLRKISYVHLASE